MTMSGAVALAARAAAKRLAADYGPGLAAEVEAELHSSDSTAARRDRYIDPVSVASLIVAIASLAWNVYTDLRNKTAEPSPEAVARMVRISLRERDDNILGAIWHDHASVPVGLAEAGVAAGGAAELAGAGEGDDVAAHHRQVHAQAPGELGPAVRQESSASRMAVSRYASADPRAISAMACGTNVPGARLAGFPPPREV
jgi:hypothetical protein